MFSILFFSFCLIGQTSASTVLQGKTEIPSTLSNPDHHDNSKLSQRLLAGTPATLGAYPSYGYGPTNCSGTLIHYDIVVATASCKDEISSKKLSFGGKLPDGSDATFSAAVKSVAVHPSFDSTTLANDIMLVQLDNGINENVIPYNSNLTIPDLYSSGILIGFGVTNNPPNKELTELQASVLFCPSIPETNATTQFCAQSLPDDKCTAYLGNPLYQNNALVGFVSSGDGMGSNPCVFTRISAFDSWIKETICILSSKRPNYCPAPAPQPIAPAPQPIAPVPQPIAPVPQPIAPAPIPVPTVIEPYCPTCNCPEDTCDFCEVDLACRFTNYCFSEFCEVITKNRGNIPIKDIIIGDYVMDGDGQFSRVYSLSHINKHDEATFKQIFVNKQTKPIELTPDHIIYANNKAVRAFDVIVGDILTVYEPDANGAMVAKNSEVTEIKFVVRKGMYSPITESGTMVVNGIVASTYNKVWDQNLIPLHWQNYFIHIGLAPYRMACTINFQICLNETYTIDEGRATWAQAVLDFHLWLMEQNILIIIVSYLVVVPVVVVAYTLEQLLIVHSIIQGMIFLMLTSFITSKIAYYTRKMSSKLMGTKFSPIMVVKKNKIE